jgi:hypothetical protein
MEFYLQKNLFKKLSLDTLLSGVIIYSDRQQWLLYHKKARAWQWTL